MPGATHYTWRIIILLRHWSKSFVACEQALSCGVGGWREEERELAIMSHKFEFLRPKSGREMLIG